MSAPTTRLVRRNYGKGHGYKLDGEKIVGVTTALNVLDKPALREWYARTAAERAVNEWDKIAGMQPTERLEYIRYGPRDRVREASIRGTEIHDLGQRLASGEEVDVPDAHVGPVQAYARWLDAWQVETIATETPLASATYGYGGTADLWAKVGRLDGAMCLLDVKTGRGVYDETALQLAGYRYSEIMQPEKGVEIATPAVEHVLVAHVLPDDVRTLPVLAGPDTFRTFLYLLQVHRAREQWREWPLVGAAVRPEDPDLLEQLP